MKEALFVRRADYLQRVQPWWPAAPASPVGASLSTIARSIRPTPPHTRAVFEKGMTIIGKYLPVPIWMFHR